MALKKTTVEEFDEAGKLIRRTVTEEDDCAQVLIPVYPAAPLYPWPAPPAVLPFPNPWHDTTPVITCSNSVKTLSSTSVNSNCQTVQ